MAYFPFRRLVFGGSLMSATTGGTPLEIWACTISISAPAFTTAPEQQLGAATSAIQTWFTGSSCPSSATVQLEYVKYNGIASNGLQQTDPTNQTLFTTPVRGGGGAGTQNAMQTSCRISMDNGTRSRRARGGFYMPRPAATIAPDGRFAVANQTLWADGAKGLVDSLNAALDGVVVIASNADAANRTVTRVRVGRVPDTQRRRRNALLEEYTERVIVPD